MTAIAYPPYESLKIVSLKSVASRSEQPNSLIASYTTYYGGFPPYGLDSGLFAIACLLL